MRITPLIVAMSLGLFTVTACDSETTESTSSTSTDSCPELAPSVRHSLTDFDTYSFGMEKRSEGGTYRVLLVQSSPIPKDTGFYTWTVEVQDQNCDPLADATVVAEPRMPSHGHGTSPATTDGTPTGEDGRLELVDMDLFMPGIWEVTLTVSGGGLGDDIVRFNFDLEG